MGSTCESWTPGSATSPLAASYADAKYAELLTGVNFFGSYTGEQMTKRFFGPIGAGTAKMGVGRNRVQPGLGPAAAARGLRRRCARADDERLRRRRLDMSSEDPERQRQEALQVRRGGHLPVLSLARRVVPRRPRRAQLEGPPGVVRRHQPKLIFKSDWLSHEQVTLAYSRWFYGAHTHAEFPDDYTRDQLDNQMFSLTFGMWF